MSEKEASQEVSGNRKEKLNDESVGEVYAMAFGFFCLQALALRKIWGVRAEYLHFLALFSQFLIGS